jgi:hypothetical protein
MGRQIEIFDDSAELDGFKTIIFEKHEAIARFLEVFEFESTILIDALMQANNERGWRNQYFPARNMGRWSDLVGSSALQICSKGNYRYNVHDGQPCLENDKLKIRLIFMSSNDDIGNASGVISSRYPKGYQTEKHIIGNASLDVNDGKYKTWICYFPSAGNWTYGDDEQLAKLEVSYPLAVRKSKSGKKFLPCNHEQRLFLNSIPEDITPRDDHESTYDDDDLDIGLKQA